MGELEQQIEKITEQQVSVETTTKHVEIENMVAPVYYNTLQLVDAGVIAEQDAQQTRCVYKSSNTELAKIETYFFPRDFVGYIHWIYLDESIREHGLARLARERAVTQLSNATVIYSEIHSEKMEHIARTQGYSPTNNEALSGWFVSN